WIKDLRFLTGDYGFDAKIDNWESFDGDSLSGFFDTGTVSYDDDYLEISDGSGSSYDEDEDEVSLTEVKENMIPDHFYHPRSLL
ncbi:Hypothetical predicted protein, partial [Olea europaea subsp. europaea]